MKNTEVNLNHFDKINIFYSKRKYRMTKDIVKDLSDLYAASCALPKDYLYDNTRVMANVAATFHKVIDLEHQVDAFWLSLFSDNAPGMKYGVVRSVTPEIVLEEMLNNLHNLQLFYRDEDEPKDSEKGLADIYGIGKPEDNKYTTKFLFEEDKGIV